MALVGWPPPAGDSDFESIIIGEGILFNSPVKEIRLNEDNEWILDEKDLNAKFWFAPDGRINLEIIRNAAWNIEQNELQVPPYDAATGGQDFEEPPPYGEEDFIKDLGSIPVMNIVMHVIGSNEEVSYFIDLGKALQQTYGHRVRIATHIDFRADVEGHGIEFFDIGVRSLTSGMFMVGPLPEKNGYEMNVIADGRAFIADAIIANPQSLAHVHCAEKLGVPLHLMSSIPTTSTRAFPHPLVNLTNTNLGPQLANRISYSVVGLLLCAKLGPVVNRFREETLRLEPLRNTFGVTLMDNVKCPTTYFRSPNLLFQPSDWPRHIREYEVQAVLQDFLGRLQINSLRCAIIDGKVAAWNVRISKRISKSTPIPLSAAAATLLQKEGLLRRKDMELFRSREYDLASQAWDPISGLLSNTWHTSADLLHGTAAGPIKAYNNAKPRNKSIKRGAWTTEKSATEVNSFATVPVGIAKGIGQIVTAGLTTPVTFPHGLTQGFHNIPIMYGDKTVREPGKINGIKSGMAAAGKGLGYGVYDGVAGFFTQPVMGAKEDGTVGLVKGFCKGVGGLVCKPAAGACGVPGYAFLGIYKQIQQARNASMDDHILACRMLQGEEESALLSEFEKADIVRRWEEHRSKHEAT
ncbi:hypothetical protein F5Y13DRAFT_182267 [Hypoxylon sp. FL1857]|nr:hypothetical protein F5Y13DRAFT_182267 [Hypoxylon sp. FL1857]